MKVTKHNYEEHALDYIEGTLPVELRPAFEGFLEENPEIAKEVRALQKQLPVLKPDLTVRFGGKRSLKRRASVQPLMIRMTSVAAVLLVGIFLFNRYRLSQADLSGPAVAPEQVAVIVPEAHTSSPDSPIIEESAQAGILADAAPLPVRAAIHTPAETVVPTVKAKVERVVVPDPDAFTMESAPSASAVSPPEQDSLPALRETEGARDAAFTRSLSEGHSLVAFHAEERNESEYERALLPEPNARVVAVTEEYVIAQTNEVILIRETRDYFVEEKNNVGFLNLLSRKGIRKLASDILTPLSEISPIKVHHDNEGRTVEFASIPVSRRLNQESEENQ